MKFMKKISLTLFIVFLMVFLLNSKTVFATNCHNYGGATTYCDDGTSYSNYGGSITYGSDGISYSNYGGSTTYGSDGSTQSNYGGSTTYSNDGTSYSNYGGSTTYGSDGSIYNDYGGSTTYGSGSGKMIKIPNREDSIQSNYGDSTNYDSINEKSLESGINCPLNSSYDSLSSSCECNYGYVASGLSCIHKENDNSDSVKIPSYLPIQQDSAPKTDRTPKTFSDEGAIYEVNGMKFSEQDLERIRNRREMKSKEMCGLNAIYLALNQECVCEVGYKKNGSVCIEESFSKEDSDLIWWNPLIWWKHFFE